MEITINGKQISRKTVGITVAVICAIILLTGIIANRVGYSASMDERAVAAVANSKKQLDEEYQAKKTELDKLTEELNAKQTLLEELNAYKESKDISKEITLTENVPISTIEPTVQPTPKVIYKELVYKYYDALLSSDNNPANWKDIGGDVELWKEKCKEYDKKAAEQTAAHFEITTEEVEKIYLEEIFD